MILANYAQQNRNCIREFGIGFTNPLAQFKPTLFPSWAATDGADTSRKLSAFNHGYTPPYSWALPMNSGGVASTLNIVGSGYAGGSSLAVKLAAASLTGSGDLAALGGLIVQAVAALVASGGVSSAGVQAFLLAVAALSGSGGVNNANRSALGAAACALTGMGTIASTASGIGAASADMTVTGTGLSTANVGQAVWEALAAANNAAGTMGEKLNDAGSASNPWTEVIESGYTAAEILKLLASVMAGKSSGGGTATVKFRDLADSSDRITATVDGSGNRTAITLNP